MNIFAISGLFVALTSLVLIFILCIYGKTKLHRIWIFFNISILVWGIGTFIVAKAHTPALAMFGWRIGIAGGVFIATFFYHFTIVFCEKKRKKFLIFAYVIPLLCNVLILARKMLIADRYNFFFESIFYPKGTIFYFLIFFGWSVIAAVGFNELRVFLNKATGVRRRQALYLFIGPLIGFVGGATVHLPSLGISIYPVGNFGVALYALIGTYAILKHRLLDVRVAFARGTILLIVYASIVGAPLLFIATSKPWLKTIFKANWFYPPLTLYTVLALLAPYFYLRLQTKAEQKRMLQQLRLHQSLKAASKTTIEVQNIDKLAKIIPRYLLRLYKKLGNNIPHISLFLKDREEKIYKIRSSVGTNKLDGKMTISLESYLVKWFTVIRYILVENGVLKEKEAEVLV
ncbi:MAG: histidine kinase N-terminal 7TM domain-containing protein, partial [Candidatus Omnitrophota bacterium]